MDVNAKPPVFRFVHGTPQELEDWINAHWQSYVVTQFAWSVIEGKQMVTAQAIRRDEVEKQLRQQAIAAGAMPGGGQRFRQ